MLKSNTRNGDSGAVHSASAQQARQSAARREDVNASAHPNQITLAELQARQGR
jgi:hypothetical protein